MSKGSVMKTSIPIQPLELRESLDATLAKNLVVARAIGGMTQHELANASYVSRATIAQLETGSSDPRLSTIVELAKALHLSPIFLLLGAPEIRALAELPDQLPSVANLISPENLYRMKELVESGLLKDRLRAARLGAAVARSHGETGIAPITAALFSAFLPGAGTSVGTVLGRLLKSSADKPAHG
jgi:transcriptional regulator with XRE-family HTH domain